MVDKHNGKLPATGSGMVVVAGEPQDVPPVTGRTLDILMTFPVGIVIIGHDRRIRWANEYTCRLAGVDGQQTILGQHCAAYLCQAQQGTCPVLDDGQTVDRSIRILRRMDGKEIPVLKSVARTELNGEPVLVETLVDIQVREQSSEAIENQKLFVRCLLDAAPTPIFYKDAEGIYLECNEAFADFWGLPKSAIIGRTNTEVMGGALAAIEQCKDLDIVTQGGALTYGLKVNAGKGARHVVYHKAAVINPRGKPAGLVGVITDITEQKRAETALAVARREFESIFENSQIGIMLMRGGRYLARCNQRLADILGYDSPEEMAGMSMRQIHVNDDRYNVFGEIHHEKLVEGKQFQVDYQLRRRDGTPVWCALSGKALDTGDLGRGVIWVIDDLEPRKRAEAALQSSLSLLDSALEATTDGILVVDRNGGIAKWNRQFLELWHIPYALAQEGRDDKLIAYVLNQLIAPHDFLARVNALYLHPGEISFDLIELVDGRFFERYSHPQRLGDEIVGRVWWFRDVTRKWIAERALQEGEARLRSITDSTQDAIIMMDHQGILTFWNPAAVTILGYRHDEAIGRNLHELLAPDRFLDAHHVAFSIFQRTGRGPCIGKTVELAARRKDGQEIDISLALSAVSLQGKWHAVGIVRDITEQKRAQKEMLETNRRLQAETARANRMAAEAEAANVAKSQFLANMSHEIRTPMNGIIGMTEMLLDTNLNDEQRDYVDVIRSSSGTLLRIINEILDFSKIEARQLNLKTMYFDLERQLADFTAGLASRAHDKGLAFNCAIDPDVPTQLMGDPQRLRQILVNLVDNAIKFTLLGEVAVRVSRLDETAEKVGLRFSISDTGIGIPKESQHDLFHPFTQVDASSTRAYGGTGLGLAISRQLAELMGGQIGVESRHGEGSTFWFNVYLEKKRGDGRSQEIHPSAFADKRVGTRDDNAAYQRSDLGMLAKMELKADTAADSYDTVWNRSVLLDRLMGDEDLLSMVANAFLEDIPSQIESIAKLVEVKDLSGVERCSHKIKGAAANVGGGALSQSALEMELAAKKGDFDRLDQQLNDLTGRFKALQEVIESHLGKPMGL